MTKRKESGAYVVTLRVVVGEKTGPRVEDAMRWVRSKSKDAAWVLKNIPKKESRKIIRDLAKHVETA